MNSLIPVWKHWIQVGLQEDGTSFDWTARATARARGVRGHDAISASLIAKAPGIWAGDLGLKALELLSREQGLPLQVEFAVSDGDRLAPAQRICSWKGSPEAIVTFERTFINLASYLSGIATHASEFAERAKKSGLNPVPRITPTRKTLPGYRDLALQSALIGGAHPHRYNLAGGLLLKENHIATAGSIRNAVQNARETIPHLLKVEIEVRNLRELREALDAGAEVIMLDNFSPDQIREAVRMKPTTGVAFEVSGGIRLGNFADFLIPGVDVLSIGSLTHSVTALDLSLLV